MKKLKFNNLCEKMKVPDGDVELIDLKKVLRCDKLYFGRTLVFCANRFSIFIAKNKQYYFFNHNNFFPLFFFV